MECCSSLPQGAASWPHKYHTAWDKHSVPCPRGPGGAWRLPGGHTRHAWLTYKERDQALGLVSLQDLLQGGSAHGKLAIRRDHF